MMDAIPQRIMPKTRAQQAICALLNTGDAAERCHAVRSLGRFGDSAAVAALTPRLRDEDIDVCIDTAEALGHLRDTSATPSLLATVRKDPDGTVKIAAIEALGRIGGDDAIALLLEIAVHRPDDLGFTAEAWDPWWDMQLKAVDALGRLRVTAAVPVITALLDDEDGQDIESEILTALARIGGTGEEILISRLTQSTPRGRRRAAHALRLSVTPTAASALGRALMDPAPEVRAAAAQALAETGAVRYLPAILLLFRDRDGNVRSSAVQAAETMSRNSDATAIPVPELIKLTRDTDTAVQIIALATLSHSVIPLDEEARNEIVAIAGNHPDAQVAAAACALIGQWPDQQFSSALAGVLAGLTADVARPPELRCAATRALGNMGHWDETVASALTRACVAAPAALRLAALHTLIKLETASQKSDPD
ncbi:MAG: HEAT repeat domain-containing protein, partial [Gammaproteobacteria bacterium]|nr:HEAT repeat domain-containing protein [Gammaproteobacteria bacterium]